MELYLKRLEIINDVNPLKKGLTIDFKSNICVLVGDNGVGKSTILDCISDTLKFKDDTYLKRSKMKKNIILDIPESKKECKVGYIDFHAHDKRFAGAFGMDMSLQLSQMRASSGQVSLLLLNKALKDAKSYKDGLVIFDEPCRGMSMKNQLVVAKIIIGLQVKLNCQVIVTTHSLLILKKLADIAQFYDVSKMADTDFNTFYTEQCDEQ